jgi:hypothetical protein
MGEVEPADRQGQLAIRPEREPLTEEEARRLGVAANRLPRLRQLRHAAATNFGSIVVGSNWGAQSIAVSSTDLQAALSLLIERDALLLASFNVTVEGI